MSPVAREILLESAIYPLIIAVLLTLAARLLPDRARPCAAGLAIVLGFMAAYGAIRGWPAMLPRSATEKLPAIALVAILAGFTHQRWSWLRRSPPWLIHAVAFALIVLWLARPRLDDAPQPFLIEAAVVWLAGIVGFLGSRTAASTPDRQGLMLAATGIGLCGVALFGGTVSLAELCLALGAALLGTLVASRAAGLARLTTCALLPSTGLLVGLGAILLMFSQAEPWLLGLVWLALLADRFSRPIARAGRRERWLFALLCVLPAALAITLARAAAGPLSGF